MAGLMLTAVGCGKKGCIDPNAVNYDEDATKDDGTCVYPEEEDHIHITLKFVHTVDGTPLEFDTLKYTNAAGNQYKVSRLNYFVSKVMFSGAAADVLADTMHYVDGQDSTTMLWHVDAHMEKGSYTGISFIFGMDSLMNHSTVFNNLPESNMAWPDPMGNNNGNMTDDGSHYMKIEGKFLDSASVLSNFNTHTGPSMGKQYFVQVSLPSSSFTAGDKDLTIEIKMDINKWYTSPNDFDFNTYGDAIMMNMAAQMALKQNGADVFSIGSITETP